MSIALFQRHDTGDDKPDYSSHAEKKYNGEHTDRPFKYGSRVHFFRHR
jgi:hypothetical protein